MAQTPPAAIKGRGTASNPHNRFDRLVIEPVPGESIGDRAVDQDFRVGTEVLLDQTQSILSKNQSPDIGFDISINPYRGCEHGCSYCYARPTHEYLGFSAGLDFETKILAKPEAPRLLREELSKPRFKPQLLGLSGVTDPYQPIEKKLKITRACLEVLRECRNPVAVVTKNHMATRDIDLLGELAHHQAATVYVSITTLDASLAARLEPRASSPRRRLQAIAELRSAGIPTGVLVAPVIPALNDHELPTILEAASDAGALGAAWVLLRLPQGVDTVFSSWLEAHFPDRKERVLSRLRQMHQGKLYRSQFGTRGRGSGPLAAQTQQLFSKTAARLGLKAARLRPSAEAFRRPGGSQMALFD